MEAAVRAFEDWEFRVLERESVIDEDESTAEEKEGGSKVDKEVSCQHHMVNAAQVNNISYHEFKKFALVRRVLQVCTSPVTCWD